MCEKSNYAYSDLHQKMITRDLSVTDRLLTLHRFGLLLIAAFAAFFLFALADVSDLSSRMHIFVVVFVCQNVQRFLLKKHL